MAKAARGAGAPPAQATAFGAAALCHLIAERETRALSDALDTLPLGPILSAPLALTRLLEAANGEVARKEITCNGFADLMISYLDAQPYETKWEISESILTATLFLKQPRKVGGTARVTLPDDLVPKLRNLAAKTFVPESDASRLSGAGAGLTDND